MSYKIKTEKPLTLQTNLTVLVFSSLASVWIIRFGSKSVYALFCFQYFQEIHTLRAQLEAAKYEVIKYCIGTLVSISAVGLAVLRIVM